jgi:hypothetical protein
MFLNCLAFSSAITLTTSLTLSSRTVVTLTSVGFITHSFPPRNQQKMSRSYRETWAMLSVGQI